jgi:NAD(P)-dependent dehydrogenase (short-subunit alcohol dehydrogenase family)
MTTTLITGANKGLGFETARRLTDAGHVVYAGARDRERGRAAAAKLGARPLVIDVTSDESVRAAAEVIARESGRLDVLVNNAGIPGGRRPVGEVTAADLLAVYDTNVLGVVRVTREFLPLLAAAPAGVIVNVGSGLGSLERATDPAAMESGWNTLAYPSAKAAVNMITVQYAKAYPDMRINVVDPGFTATDLNGHRGTQTVEQGAAVIVALASVGPDGPTGGFFDDAGRVPW